MKISRILPLALAMLLATTCANAAYTGPSSSEQSDMSINVTPYLHIERTTPAEESAAVTSFDEHYSGINLDKAMHAAFKVSNNLQGQTIYLRALVASSDSGNVAALGGSAASPVIVFGNTDSFKPSGAAVADALKASPTLKNNANAIAFAITRTLDHAKTPGDAATSAAGEDMIADGAGGGQQIEYTLQNGIYTFDYVLDQVAVPATFSTHDHKGTYKATLMLTSTAG